MNNRIRFFVLFFLTCIALSCSPDHEIHVDDDLKGSWNARWQLMDTTLYDIFNPDQVVMNGELIFQKNNRIIIRAFGFKGNAFASDTAQNELTYHHHDSLIDLINEDRDVVFSYRIRSFEPDHICLSLMNDIQLELTK